MMKEAYIKKHVLGFYKGGKNPGHRFQSWENCYRFFQWLKEHPANFQRSPEIACLQLGFYLASWGMYRGSSFLLKHSFEVHKKPIRELLKRKYDSLWQADIGTLSSPTTIDNIFTLADSVRQLYPSNITDTLLTKIILGTIGCAPAYDRFFKDGCKTKGIRPYSNFNKRSFVAFVKFYQKNCRVFASTAKTIGRSSGVSYPPMKLVDMFF